MKWPVFLLIDTVAMDLAILPSDVWTKMGLPKLPDDAGPYCSGLPGTKACTPEELIQDVNNRPPVYHPFHSPVYSNIGYALLGMVVEAASGREFVDLVQEKIYDVAGMNSSSFYGPVDAFEELGFVPEGESTWNVTVGVFEP